MPQNRTATGESPLAAGTDPRDGKLDLVIEYLINGLVACYPDSPLEQWRIDLALAIADQDLYAAGLLDVDDTELVRRHEFASTVAASSIKQPGPFFVLLAMHAQFLADLCTREGMRRGDDPRWGRLH